MATTRISKFFIILIVCFPLRTHAQADERQPFSFGARAHYGFIIPHSKDIAGVSDSRPFGIEANIQWWLTGEKHTRQSGIVAKRGFVVHYINYDHPNVLGYCISVAPYIEPLIRPHKRLYGSVQMSLGLSYISKVYDANTNPTNLFFSTPFSFLLMTNGYVTYKISPHWEASLGFNYNHISNGGMREPNKGMNFPTYNVGTTYHLRPFTIRRPVRNQDWKNQSRYYAYLHAVGSIKKAEATAAFPENKPCWLLGAIVMGGRRIGRMSALAAGTEWIHDGWAREVLDREGISTSAWKGGALFGHELIAGRVRFTIHLGAYLYNPSRTTDLVYQRYGLFYQFGKHIQFGSTLKAHRHVADVFDIRLGWLW